MGTLRLYLAVCVFLWHCWITDYKHVVGAGVAVFCFFIISGFLISMTLMQNYPETSSGTLRFYLNRALRLFPSYLAVLFVCAVTYSLGVAPFRVPGINDGFHMAQAIDQITVLPVVLWHNLSLDLAPTSFTLMIGWYYMVGLEMIFYALAPFFVRWKLPNLILLFVGCGILHFVPPALGLPERPWQYEFFPSTSVFFVAGVLSYRVYLAIKDTANRCVGWILLPGIIAYGALHESSSYTNDLAPIVMYLALTLLIPFLFIASQRSRVDKFLGDISYPFYIVHGLAAELVGGGIGRPTNILAGLSLSFALSIGCGRS
jgi:peptidoglycan/LPS O-acetylase OafA/YrhL